MRQRPRVWVSECVREAEREKERKERGDRRERESVHGWLTKNDRKFKRAQQL